jgi:hypothetical protein
MLNYLQGTEDELGAKKSKAKKTAKKEKKKEKKSSKPVKKHKVAKVAVAPARNAYLLAVSLNALGLGKKLAKGWKKDSQRLISFWTKLGGNSSALKKAIEKGSKQTLSGEDEMGVALEVTLATALPIIVATTKILKDLGVTSPKEQSDEQNAINQSKKDLANDESVPKGTAELPEGTESGKEGTPDQDGKIFGMSPLVLGTGVVVVGGAIYMATQK